MDKYKTKKHLYSITGIAPSIFTKNIKISMFHWKFLKEYANTLIVRQMI